MAYSPINLIFFILSASYVSAIFFLADSPAVSTLASFNPYSLLHIPLYGILTVLLVFSLLASAFKGQRLNDPKDESNRFMIAGFIALGVAIVDEIYQSLVPGRDASVSDVLLDIIGIGAAMLLMIQFHKSNRFLIVHRKE
jgi:VanZ family protein